MPSVRIRNSTKASIDGAVRFFRAGSVVADVSIADLERVMPGNFDVIDEAPVERGSQSAMVQPTTPSPAPVVSARRIKKLFERNR